VMAEAFVRHVGKRVPIPEELLADAAREVEAPLNTNVALRMIATSQESPLINADAHWGLDEKGNVIAVANPTPLVGQAKIDNPNDVFAPAVLNSAAVYLPFVYAALPVGDALRAHAPDAHARVLARLRNPSLLMDAAYDYYVDDAGRATIAKVVELVGGEPVKVLPETSVAHTIPGAIVIFQGNALVVKARPAELDANAFATVKKVTAGIKHWGHHVLRSIEYIRSADLAQMMARIADTPVPTGGWEQNPLASAPKLVDKVAKKLGVSRDAAALYLIYLAMLWPTAKNIAEWTGWKAKQLDALNDELVDKDLILTAKRERAQRGHFLPGGWEALKSPHPPLESWKVPLYATRNAEGDVVPPMGRLFAMAPFHVLFERAWKRIEDGDLPKYDEVKR
jgi:hypothetical protein